MGDDTPVSSTVSTGGTQGEGSSSAEANGRSAPDNTLPPEPSELGVTPLARPSGPPSSMFEPTSEEEEMAVDSGWGALRPPPTASPSEAPFAEAALDSEPRSSVTHATPKAPEVERLAQSEAARRRSVLPRLELSEPEPPRLLYEKAQEPSEESPILYCERVFVVDSLFSDEELAEHLLSVLGSIRESWRERDSSQFVQLASFDHSFESEPRFPPLATLSWKDWQGRAELWVRGVRHSGPPPTLSGAELGAALETAAEESNGSERGAESSSEISALGTIHESDATPLVAPVAPKRPRPGDSGTSWQSPARSGEYPIPNTNAADETPETPPSSQRVPAGEELIGALFERMNELSYVPDVRAGAAYLVETLEEFIPCSGIAIHVLDPAACEFVLVRALAPRAADQLGTRQSDVDSVLGAAVREQRALRSDGARNPLWRALGLEIAHALCAPVQQRGHVFGAIELGRTLNEGAFTDSQLQALEFVAEQFADFLSDRPFNPRQLP